MPRRNRRSYSLPPLFPFLRKPAGQLAVVLIVVLIVMMIALGGQNKKKSGSEVSVDEALVLYQNGVFVLDVSWPAEWDEYHLPAATLIPLDQLYNRYNELPKDRQILILSRSQASSQQAREFLANAGFNAVSMAGSLSEWYAKGYPIDGAPPQ